MRTSVDNPDVHLDGFTVLVVHEDTAEGHLGGQGQGLPALFHGVIWGA